MALGCRVALTEGLIHHQDIRRARTARAIPSERGHAWSAPPFDPRACGRSFVAEDDGRIVGFRAAFVRSDCWYFSALFIDPVDQGPGIGRQLPHHLFPLERGSRGQAVRPGRPQGCIAL